MKHKQTYHYALNCPYLALFFAKTGKILSNSLTKKFLLKDILLSIFSDNRGFLKLCAAWRYMLWFAYSYTA